MFKIGDRVRRIKINNVQIEFGYEDIVVHVDSGHWIYLKTKLNCGSFNPYYFELVEKPKGHLKNPCIIPPCAKVHLVDGILEAGTGYLSLYFPNQSTVSIAELGYLSNKELKILACQLDEIADAMESS